MEFYYTYPEIEEDFELKKLLRECKNNEERERLLIEYQIIRVIFMIKMFLVSVGICWVISLLFNQN